MATAKFNGKHCPMCGAEFIAGQSEIEPHPTEVGPKGGKVWVCAEHVHGASENPFMNAGRRTSRGVQKPGRKSALTRAAVPENDYRSMSLAPRDPRTKAFIGELARRAANKDAGAIAEINRRERAASAGGVKVAWTLPKAKKAKKPKAKKASNVRQAANPFGY
jgi:hypothetical protein